MFRCIRAIMCVAAFAASASLASAQSTTDSPAPSATAPPKAPSFPLPPKPDFSSMRFLLGTWSCGFRSERRGTEVSHQTVTYTMAPDGYFLKFVTKAPKVSYTATGFTTTDWITYDARAGRWIDITIGTYGAYGYSTSTGWEHGHILWGADSFLPDGDSTSTTGTLMTKVSDTKVTSAGAFTTSAGLLNRVSGTCVKT
jgi:hypothetical protein